MASTSENATRSCAIFVSSVSIVGLQFVYKLFQFFDLFIAEFFLARKERHQRRQFAVKEFVQERVCLDAVKIRFLNNRKILILAVLLLEAESSLGEQPVNQG